MHLKEVYRNNAAAVDTLLREKMTAFADPWYYGVAAVWRQTPYTKQQWVSGIERHTLWTAVRCLSRRL